jgi:hypothetical protein
MDHSVESNLFLLNLPIVELPLSEEFKLRSQVMGYFTLQDILTDNLPQLHTKENYSERWYFEFVDFLQRKELIYLLG